MPTCFFFGGKEYKLSTLPCGHLVVANMVKPKWIQRWLSKISFENSMLKKRISHQSFWKDLWNNKEFTFFHFFRQLIGLIYLVSRIVCHFFILFHIESMLFHIFCQKTLAWYPFLSSMEFSKIALNQRWTKP